MCKSHNQRRRNGLPIFCECGESIPLKRSYRENLCVDCKNKILCKNNNCFLPAKRKGRCMSHYYQFWRNESESFYCLCGKEIQSAKAKYCDKCRRLARRTSNRKSEARRRDISRKGVRYNHTDIFKEDNAVCYLCGLSVIWEEFEIEHVIPISKGGPDAPFNVATSHKACNRAKRALDLDDVVMLFPSIKIPRRVETWLLNQYSVQEEN